MNIKIEPIGYVKSSRAEAIDDDWDSVESRIELADGFSGESLAGLADFSHVEIIYHFNKVDPSKVILKAEHPRENPAWPKVGIFAQRKKARPNLLGATIARVVRVEGRTLWLSGFDAIDGTPVLDIKPVFREYLPRGEVRQPEWVGELMSHYWE